MMPEGLISHNFSFYIPLKAFSEFLAIWFPRDRPSTIFHPPAETAIPISRPTPTSDLSGNSERFWSNQRHVPIEGKSE
jgi:hypothetical protein